MAEWYLHASKPKKNKLLSCSKVERCADDYDTGLQTELCWGTDILQLHKHWNYIYFKTHFYTDTYFLFLIQSQDDMHFNSVDVHFILVNNIVIMLQFCTISSVLSFMKVYWKWKGTLFTVIRKSLLNSFFLNCINYYVWYYIWYYVWYFESYYTGTFFF